MRFSTFLISKRMELIDLQKGFDLINKNCFGGSLPLPALSYNKRCFRTFGRCYIYRRKIEIITCQKRGGRDAFSYLNTLAHEICHYWLNIHGCKDSGHDAKFHAIAKYLNGFGFKIYNKSYYDAEVNSGENICGSWFFDGVHLYNNGVIYR